VVKSEKFGARGVVSSSFYFFLHCSGRSKKLLLVATLFVLKKDGDDNVELAAWSFPALLSFE